MRVGDLEGIRVFHEGNPVGRTDRSGEIVLPRMTPYTANRITIDERDIPIDVAIKIVKSASSRSFARVRSPNTMRTDVPVQYSKCGSPTAHTCPVGSEVQLVGTSQSYIVGHDGEVFIPDLPVLSRFTVKLAIRPLQLRSRVQSAEGNAAKAWPVRLPSRIPVRSIQRLALLVCGGIGQHQHADFCGLFMQRIERRID